MTTASKQQQKKQVSSSNDEQQQKASKKVVNKDVPAKSEKTPKKSTLINLLRQFPSSHAIQDELHALISTTTSNSTPSSTSQSHNQRMSNNMKIVSDFAATVSKLFEELQQLINNNEVKSLLDFEETKNFISAAIISLNFGDRRLLSASVLAQFFSTFKSQIPINQLKELEKTLSANQVAECLYISCLHESDLIPVTAVNIEEWEARIAQLLAIYNHKTSFSVRNLVIETLIGIVKSAMKHDKEFAKKKIVDAYVAPLITPEYSSFRLHHFALTYYLSQLYPKSFTLRSNDQTDANILTSTKFIDELYAYLQTSDQLPPIVDAHIDELAKANSDVISARLNYFMDRGVFIKSGVKSGADYCAKVLSHSDIGISKFPLTNQTYLRSWPNTNKRTPKKGLFAINKLDKLIKKKMVDDQSVLVNLVDLYEKDQKNTSLKNLINKSIAHSLHPDMASLLAVVKHVLKNNFSDATTSLVISAIETNCRIYDSQKCEPRRILELLKLLFVPAFFESNGTSNETLFVLRTTSISDELRQTITNRLLEFLRNLSLLEQHYEISKTSNVESNKPKVPTQMKAWSLELLNFEQELLKTKATRDSVFTEETDSIRKVLKSVRETIRTLLKRSDHTSIQTAQLCSLKVLVNNIMVCQLHDPEVISSDMADDLLQFLNNIFSSKSKSSKDKEAKSEEGEEKAPEPMEVFTDVLVGLVTAEQSLTYATRMCLFAFSSYLNSECFQLLFQALYDDSSKDENEEDSDEDMDDESDNEAEEPKESSNEKPTAEEESEEDEESEDDEAEDEKMGDDEEEDPEADWTDEKMFSIDGTIAAAFKLRRLEAEKRKKTNQPQIEVAKNIVSMLEGLVHKNTPSSVLLNMFVECLDFIRGSINNPRAVILERVIAIAKNITKPEGRGKSIMDAISVFSVKGENTLTFSTQLTPEQLAIIEEKVTPQLSHILSFANNRKLSTSKASQHLQNSVKSLLFDKCIPFLIALLDRIASVRTKANKNLPVSCSKIICKALAQSGFKFKIPAAFAWGVHFLMPRITAQMTSKFLASGQKARSDVIRFYHFVVNNHKSKGSFFSAPSDIKNIFEVLIALCPTFEEKIPSKSEFTHFTTTTHKVVDLLIANKVGISSSLRTKTNDVLTTLKEKQPKFQTIIDKLLNAVKEVKHSDKAEPAKAVSTAVASEKPAQDKKQTNKRKISEQNKEGKQSAPADSQPQKKKKASKK